MTGFDKVLSIGLELELMSNDIPDYCFEEDMSGFTMARHDGSVEGAQQRCANCREAFHHCCCDEYEDDYYSEEIDYYNFVGEIASRPIYSVKQIREFLKEFASAKTNRSCSTHCHFKLSYRDYLTLVWNYDKFNKALREHISYFGKSRNIGESHQYWKRQVSNHYCSPRLTLSDVRSQLINNSYDSCRYRNVNFCWTKHGTLELRHLPAFKDYELRLDAILSLIDFVNSFLRAHKIKKTTFEVIA